MARGNVVEVKFIGDADDVKRAMREAGTAGDTFMTKMKGIGGVATGVFGGIIGTQAVQALAQFGADSIKAASDANESLSKVRTVFGESAPALEAWAKTASESLGMSRREALDAAGSFGNMFTQLGLTTGQASDMSTQMVQLATDLGSFHNAAPIEVLEAMSSAFRGEYDALQRYIPTINAATVQEKALAMGLAATTSELTAQDTALAVQALVMEGAGAAVGDYARTSDSLANKQRELTAKFDDLKVMLGEKLLPVAVGVTTWLADSFIPWVENAHETLQPFIGGLGKVVSLLDWIAGNDAYDDLYKNVNLGTTAGGISGGIAAKVPKFHDGGMYRAPTPGGQGLAMLRDGERVLTPDQSGGPTINLSVNAQVIRSDREFQDLIMEVLRDWTRRNGGMSNYGVAV